MIKEITGDIFKTDAAIICHQVNCKGVMGAGIAKMVKEKMGKLNFDQYQLLCRKYGTKMLGEVLYAPNLQNTLKQQYFANCFAQDGYGRSGQYTDYDALKKCLQKVHDWALKRNLVIAIPSLIGCGLAGGDWNYVKKNIIAPIFQESDVELVIYYFTQELFEGNAGF